MQVGYGGISHTWPGEVSIQNSLHLAENETVARAMAQDRRVSQQDWRVQKVGNFFLICDLAVSVASFYLLSPHFLLSFTSQVTQASSYFLMVMLAMFLQCFHWNKTFLFRVLRSPPLFFFFFSSLCVLKDWTSVTLSYLIFITCFEGWVTLQQESHLA